MLTATLGKLARDLALLGQTEVGEALGLKQSAMSNIEKGQRYLDVDELLAASARSNAAAAYGLRYALPWQRNSTDRMRFSVSSRRALRRRSG